MLTFSRIMGAERLVYSPSARYACRYNRYEASARSSHKFHINDFETEKIYAVYLTSNYNAKIMHYYWPDEDHICVIYKKTSNAINAPKDSKELNNCVTIDCNRECRMLYKVKGFEQTEEFFAVDKKTMKAYANNNLMEQCLFSEQYLTINGKEYFVMFHDPWYLRDHEVNQDKPWEDIPEDEDPWGNEPITAKSEEELEDFRKEQKIYKDVDYSLERMAEASKKARDGPERCLTKVWFRFIPKQFADEELPDVPFDMKEALETFGIDIYCAQFPGPQPKFAHVVFARGPYFYMVHNNYNVLKMNLQAFFDTFLKSGARPRFEDFCEKLALPAPAYDNGGFIDITTNNGFMYMFRSKMHPKTPLFCKDRLIAALEKTITWPKLRFLLRLNRLRDFRMIGDVFVHIIGIEKNEHVETLKMVNKRDMFNGNDDSIHPSGHILVFRGEAQQVNTRYYLGLEYNDHWLKHIRLAPVATNSNVLPMIDDSKTPKFIKNGKKMLNMKLENMNCKEMYMFQVILSLMFDNLR